MGHIPITHISSVFTRRLESTSPPDSSDEEGNSDEDEEGKADLPALHDMFSVGQYVRAVVTAVSPSGVSGTLGLNKHGDETQKASRRVELSISPDQVNESISKKDLGPGFVSSDLFIVFHPHVNPVWAASLEYLRDSLKP
jgi:rRNA biogenesis protein RRP5